MTTEGGVCNSEGCFISAPGDSIVTFTIYSLAYKSSLGALFSSFYFCIVFSCFLLLLYPSVVRVRERHGAEVSLSTRPFCGPRSFSICFGPGGLITSRSLRPKCKTFLISIFACSSVIRILAILLLSDDPCGLSEVPYRIVENIVSYSTKNTSNFYFMIYSLDTPARLQKYSAIILLDYPIPPTPAP